MRIANIFSKPYFMHTFKDFQITSSQKTFTGDKIKIDRILNREIIVEAYKIEKSKFEKASGRCLHLQISLGQTKHVVFTGSVVLMDQIEKVPKDKIPFITTIVRENERLQFT
jgi:hypothetical protein